MPLVCRKEFFEKTLTPRRAIFIWNSDSINKVGSPILTWIMNFNYIILYFVRVRLLPCSFKIVLQRRSYTEGFKVQRVRGIKLIAVFDHTWWVIFNIIISIITHPILDQTLFQVWHSQDTRLQYEAVLHVRLHSISEKSLQYHIIFHIPWTFKKMNTSGRRRCSRLYLLFSVTKYTLSTMLKVII